MAFVFLGLISVLLGLEREGNELPVYALRVFFCACVRVWNGVGVPHLQRSMGNVVYSCCLANAVLWPDGGGERERERMSLTPLLSLRSRAERFQQSLLINFCSTWRTFSHCLRARDEPKEICMLNSKAQALFPSHGMHVLFASGQTGRRREVSLGQMDGWLFKTKGFSVL